MRPIEEEICRNTRMRIGKWRQLLLRLESGQVKMHRNGVDTTPEMIEMFRNMVAQDLKLLGTYDPHGVTDEGGIEFGEVDANLAPLLTPGRPVSYSLDPEGHIWDLRVWPTDTAARADAEANDRLAGWIGQDSWSVVSIAPER